jgi:hypothetical protein
MNDLESIVKSAHDAEKNEQDVSNEFSIPVYEIRREESRLGIYLKGFPKSAKNISYTLLNDMMIHRMMPIAQIADTLSLTKATVTLCIKHYHIVVDDDTKSQIRRNAYLWASKKSREVFNDPESKARIMKHKRDTCMRRYGTSSPILNAEVRKKIDNTLIEKYGKGGSPFANKDIQEKSRKTMMKKYGSDISWKSEAIKTKIKETNLERYGVDNPMKSPDIKKKASNTNLERYGVKWNTECKASREKAKESYIRHYGVDNPSKSPEVLDKITSSMNRGYSEHERIVAELLNDLDIPYITNDHTIIGKELDFIIPSRKLAIEVSPVFTHHSNERQIMTVPPKPPAYHKNKHDMAEKAGYELITLFDRFLIKDRWETMTAPFITMKVLGKATRTLYARQTVIYHETNRKGKDSCRRFIADNHFNGNTPAQEYFAIYEKGTDNMVGAFSLRHPTGRADNFIELSRLAWKADTQVRYGLSKIVNFIAKTMTQSRFLLSFSDNDMGNGYSYLSSGFSYDGYTEPSLHFVNPHDAMDCYSWQVATPWGAKSGVISRLIHPMEVNKREAKKIVETILPHRTDNGHGYFSYYDSGNKRWIYDLNELR